MEGGRTAWISHIKKVAREKGIKYGEAMKIASKTFKGGAGPGGLAMPPMGGRRRSTRKVKGGASMPAMPSIPGIPGMGGRRRRSTRKMMGGTAYGFGGGPYTGSDLSDGMTRFPSMPDATYQGPSSLKGGRRRRHTRRR